MVERRDLLRGAIVSALSGLSGGCGALVASRRHEETREDDLAILNGALGLEYQLVATYRLAADRGLLRSPFRRFGEDHARHAESLRNAIAMKGGAPVPAPAGLPDGGLPEDEAGLLRFLEDLERGIAETYLGAVPAFLDRDLARRTAGIFGVETMHWALLRGAMGLEPLPGSFID